MIKKYNGFEAKIASGGSDKLPVGCYICKILNPEVVDYSWGSVLVLNIDVMGGEYKDFFANQYKANTNEDKKWRGTLRINLPKDDGSEKDAWTKNSFQNAIGCIEEANAGYHWNWDESSLKGKIIGVAVREEEWEVNGNNGWSTRPWRAIPVKDIEDGKINEKWLAPKPLKAKSVAIPQNLEPAGSVSDYDLPWN